MAKQPAEMQAAKFLHKIKSTMNQEQIPLDDELRLHHSQKKLQITESVRRNWREIAGWILFFSWTGILIAFVLLISFIRAFNTYLGVSTSTLVLVIISVVVILGISVLGLIQSRNIRMGLEREESKQIEQAFSQMRIWYMIITIAMVITIVFFILSFVIGLYITMTSL
jgi:magnesium-transporting ATPase (P-type)